MTAFLDSALDGLLDFLYRGTADQDVFAARLAEMYVYGLAALLLVSMVLDQIIIRVSVFLASVFRKRGHSGTFEGIKFSARIYCTLERILWRINPIGLWYRIFYRGQSRPVLIRVPLNVLLHAFSFSITNAIIWISIFIYLKPPIPTSQQLSDIYGTFKGIEIAKIIAWTTVALVLLLLQRGAMIRGRIRFEEDAYIEAIKMLSQLESPLRKLINRIDDHPSRLAWDCDIRFPQIFVNNVTDSEHLAYSPGSIVPQYRSPLELRNELEGMKFNENLDDLLQSILDISIQMEKQALWIRAHRLLARVSWDLSQLGLNRMARTAESDLRTERDVLDQISLKFMAPRWAIDITKKNGQRHRLRYRYSVERGMHEEPRVDIEKLNDTQRARLIEELTQEADRYRDRCRQWLADAIVSTLCAKRVVQAISEVRFASGSSHFASRVFKPFG